MPIIDYDPIKHHSILLCLCIKHHGVLIYKALIGCIKARVFIFAHGSSRTSGNTIATDKFATHDIFWYVYMRRTQFKALLHSK